VNKDREHRKAADLKYEQTEKARERRRRYHASAKGQRVLFYAHVREVAKAHAMKGTSL
jgi:hypothetical protein